jgi:hypothetical protein
MTDSQDSGKQLNGVSDSASGLANILLMTQEMLELARDEDWSKVTDLEEERRNLLATCFASPIPEEQSQLFSEALAAMLQMNEEMIGLLEAAKENVAIKRTDQTHKKRSLGHYLDIEKSH